jgi:hypothetical protein
VIRCFTKVSIMAGRRSGCEDFGDRLLQSEVIVRDDELDAMQAAGFNVSKNSFQLDRLSRLASSTASAWRRPSRSTPMVISTA